MAAVREFEKVIDFFIGKVKDGSFQIGSELPSERQISSDLSISRNSVREGIRTLENMGAIQSRHGSGNYVSGSVSESIKRAFDIMLLLQKIDMKEVLAYRKSTELSVFDLAIRKVGPTTGWDALSGLLEGYMELPLSEQIRRDREFHYQLVKAADNPILMVVMSSISDIYRLWIRDVLVAASTEEMRYLHNAHARIFQSLREKDKEAGIQAIDDHYDMIDRIFAKTK